MDNLTSNSNTEMTSSIFHNHLKKYLVNSWFWSRKMFAPWFMACAKRSIRFLRWRMMSSKIHIFLSVCCSNGSRSLSGRTSKSLYIFNGENCNKTSVPKPETCCVCAGCTCYEGNQTRWTCLLSPFLSSFYPAKHYFNSENCKKTSVLKPLQASPVFYPVCLAFLGGVSLGTKTK